MKKEKKQKRLSGESRRKFLQSGGQAMALALVSPVLASSEKKGTGARAFKTKAFELEEATVAQLQEAMATGKFTARSVAERYLAQIEEIDKAGPGINSVIEINPDALAIADAMDQERKSGKTRGALHGVPVLLKDNIDTADKMLTTAGSLALMDSRPQRDSFVARRLREAGAVILGKTNLSEWANFRSTKSSSGWSGRGGLTKNPYALDRNTSGSSSGSGASIAANLCAVAIGTETDGSIVSPSSTCGIVGIKPTVGLVSRSGIIPIAHSQDTAGPMTRTVADAVHLLGALTGIDERDAVTKESRRKALADYTKFLDQNGLRGARIGVARKSFGFNERVDKLMEEALDVMKRSGATIVDPADIPTTAQFGDSEFEVLLYEFKADLNAYFQSLGPNAPVRSMKELIEFNEKNKDKEMPYFSQDLCIKAEAKGPLTSPAYRRALAKNHRLTRAQGIDAVMKKFKLDALVAPTGGPAWTTDLLNGDHYTGGYSSASAIAGYPHITVPAGFVYGLPIGISFFAEAYSEPKLIKLAYSFEQATKHRRQPKFLTTADLSV
jgi:amidase